MTWRLVVFVVIAYYPGLLLLIGVRIVVSLLLFFNSNLTTTKKNPWEGGLFTPLFFAGVLLFHFLT